MRNKSRSNRNGLTNAESQLRMYDCMTPHLVSKVLDEFQNGEQCKFGERIQEKRQEDNTLDKTLQISARVPSNSSHVYLNYKRNNSPVMHLSIHLCPENISSIVGPTHVKLNWSKKQGGVSVHVYRDPNNPSKIRVELGSEFGQSMNPSYRKEAELVAESLDDFFNEAAQNTNQPQNQNQNPLHKNAQRIHQNIQTALRKHNKTQRRKYRKAPTRGLI